jgi:hypothetical protein
MNVSMDRHARCDSLPVYSSSFEERPEIHGVERARIGRKIESHDKLHRRNRNESGPLVHQNGTQIGDLQRAAYPVVSGRDEKDASAACVNGTLQPVRVIRFSRQDGEIRRGAIPVADIVALRGHARQPCTDNRREYGKPFFVFHR